MPFLMNAPQRIVDIVADVARNVGLSTVPEVLYDLDLEGTVNAYNSSRITEDGEKVYGLFLPPAPLTVFKTDANLRAVIAHELGHIANQDDAELQRIMHRREYRADAFAASHGYDIASLLKLTPDDSEDLTHPSVTARLQRVHKATK